MPPRVVEPPTTIPLETLRPPANVEEADAESPVNVEKPPNVEPPANVEVPVFVMLRSPEERIFPPVIVRPADEARPADDIPPVNVEVAVEVAFMNPTVGEVEALNTPVDESYVRLPTAERDVEDTFWLKIFQSEERRNPSVELEEVEIANTPDWELYERGANAERDVEDTLLLNVVLSAVLNPSYPVSYEMARVPDVVTGEPEIVNPVGTEAATEVTEPVPAQSPEDVRKQPEVREIPPVE